MQDSPGAVGVDGSYTSNVPAFLTKLWTLVEDPDTNHLICWSAVSPPSKHTAHQTVIIIISSSIFRNVHSENYWVKNNQTVTQVWVMFETNPQ